MNLKKHFTYHRLLLTTILVAELFVFFIIKSNNILSDKEKAEIYIDSVRNVLFQKSNDSVFIKPFEIPVMGEKFYNKEVVEDGKEKIKSYKDPKNDEYTIIYDIYTDIISVPGIQYKGTLKKGIASIVYYTKESQWIGYIVIDSVTEIKLKNLSLLRAEWEKYEKQPRVPSYKLVYEQICSLLFILLLASVILTLILRNNSLSKK